MLYTLLNYADLRKDVNVEGRGKEGGWGEGLSRDPLNFASQFTPAAQAKKAIILEKRGNG